MLFIRWDKSDSSPEALCNFWSGSWLAWALMTRRPTQPYECFPRSIVCLSMCSELRPDDGRCPAVTIDSINPQHLTGVKKKIFSVDIVPAVRLLEWPHPAQSWSSHWLYPTTLWLRSKVRLLTICGRASYRKYITQVRKRIEITLNPWQTIHIVTLQNKLSLFN